MDVQDLIDALRGGTSTPTPTPSGQQQVLQAQTGAGMPQPAMSVYQQQLADAEKRRVAALGSANPQNNAALWEAR